MRCTVPGVVLVLSSVDLPGSGLGDDSITPEGRFVVQSATDFEAATRSSKLFLALFSSTGSSGKWSMAVVSMVVVEPESELIDSVVISWPCDPVDLPMLMLELVDLVGVKLNFSLKGYSMDFTSGYICGGCPAH